MKKEKEEEKQILKIKDLFRELNYSFSSINFFLFSPKNVYNIRKVGLISTLYV